MDFAFAFAMFLSAPAHCAALRTLAGAGVGVGPLTATRQAAPMAKPTIATEVHEPLDVHVDLAPEVTLDLEIQVDALADLLDVVFVEIVGSLALRDTRRRANVLRVMRTDPEDVLQRNHRMFSTWEVDACDTCHSLLSLPLLMTGVVTQDTHDTLAAHDLALVTNFSDAWSNLHFSLSLIRPLVGSKGEISTITSSPGRSFTVTCLAFVDADAVISTPSSSLTR
jgi:hypothetical protein